MADLTKAQIEESITEVILTDARRKGAINADDITRQFAKAGIEVEAVTVTKAEMGISRTSNQYQAQVDKAQKTIFFSKETGNVIDPSSESPRGAYKFVSEKISLEEFKNGGTVQIGSSSTDVTVVKAASPQDLQQELDVIMKHANRGNFEPYKNFLRDKGEIPQNIADNFIHPDFKEIAKSAACPDVKCTGSELTYPSTPRGGQIAVQKLR
jgi:hypothetical protein